MTAPLERYRQIKIIGVGDAGGAALNRLHDEGVRRCELIAINTHAQTPTKVKTRVQLGEHGAGGAPRIARLAAEQQRESIYAAVQGADLIVLVAGMGGGTGTGASSVIARIVTEMGAAVYAVISRPFAFEGDLRRRIAREGIDALQLLTDHVTLIDNDSLLPLMPRTPDINHLYTLAAGALAWGVIARLTTP